MREKKMLGLIMKNNRKGVHGDVMMGVRTQRANYRYPQPLAQTPPSN